MLKLIATDMDGTLLNNNHEMPMRTFEIIDQLHERGITFAVATGRGHHSILKIYDKIKDDIVMITNNGAIIIDKGEIIAAQFLPRIIAQEIVEAIQNLPKVSLMVKGIDSAYFFGEDILATIPTEILDDHFPKHTVVNGFADIPTDDEIVQIVVYDPDCDPEKNARIPLLQFEDNATLAVSGDYWLDIMAKNINKGNALAQLQEMLDANPDETMVFGDQMNDYELMQSAYYSYAMDNAVEPIKAVANFVAPSNEDEGVIKIIENFLAMTAELNTKNT